ncbi:flagellar basal-body MS-ring/collar protein FliF [Kineobactrum salinum]|uniref:Flagellar M-ring protein n=1 Tax=Kineobactrum salinum TaxID=2708301 RepID=A0A6C0TX07_9GAMM|nr:flagellar basal-body MS-ring/collar protein FliF [Kineobactrum salinum]QIB64321.1 flagellar basal body M-ring protein FliF [Kineobactrum salinum]
MSNGPSAIDGTKQDTPQASATIPPWLAQLRRNPLIPLLIGGAAVIAVVTALFLWASAPEYRVLYSNLGEADGGRIITELEQRAVPYRFGAGGQTLLVPADQVHSLRLRLAEQGLPRGGNVGFEIMDNQAFGVSQFSEQVNFQRGLEGQLAGSIEALGPVARARVHLAMARPSVFVRDHKPAKASVVLTLQPGRALGEGQVSAIVHLVSSAVPELAVEDITVVDQHGALLSRTGSIGGDDLDGTQLDFTRDIERNYRQRIEAILSPILGSSNVRAQVTAQVDFASREETAESYRPNQDDNEAAVRSAQTRTSFSSGDGVARGVPGALSNTPPGAAPSPVELPPADEDGEQEGNENNRGPDNLQREDVFNYEVDRNIVHTQHRRGRIERLSVAVVVNYRDGLNEEGESVQQPITEAELEQISRLVRQAMGFSEARGDALEIVNSPFTESKEEIIVEEWWQSAEIQRLALTLGRYLLVALLALFLYFLLLRPLIRKYTAAQPAPAVTEEPRLRATVGDDDQASGGEESGDPEDGTYDVPRGRRRKSSGYEQNLADLQLMATEDPAMLAMIVRNWIAKYE